MFRDVESNTWVSQTLLYSSSCPGIKIKSKPLSLCVVTVVAEIWLLPSMLIEASCCSTREFCWDEDATVINEKSSQQKREQLEEQGRRWTVTMIWGFEENEIESWMSNQYL